jgi:SAM-dependent methyltransferase
VVDRYGCRVNEAARPPPERRQLLTRYLQGEGVEIGPGHHPFPLPYGGVSVRYIDRWLPDENRSLFGELGDVEFPRPDIVADLDVDRLSALGDATQDFVIASHILEHLAEPLGALVDIHRVLRPGGVVFILLPDRRHTFDAGRPPTSLEHLVSEHDVGVTDVDDQHIEEYLRATGDDLGTDAETRSAIFDVQRRRSIHVHCWSEDEFPSVIEHTIAAMDLDWELLDALFVGDVPRGMEFGLVLRRSAGALPPDVAASRFRDVWQSMSDDSARRAQRRADGEAAIARLERLRRVPGYELARGAYGRARRWTGRSAT